MCHMYTFSAQLCEALVTVFMATTLNGAFRQTLYIPQESVQRYISPCTHHSSSNRVHVHVVRV